MQVVVKTPHIKVEGEIPEILVEYLRREFGDVEIYDNDDELIEITESEWYKTIRGAITPGENVRVYRELHGLTQEELGVKLGNFTRQNISNMENGHRQISKTTAKKLAALFDVSVEKFL